MVEKSGLWGIPGLKLWTRVEKRSKKVDWGGKVVEKSGLRWKSDLKKWTGVEKWSKKVD